MVAPAGDVDGDGYADILVGASTFDDVQADEGAAFLYPGSSGGPAAVPSFGQPRATKPGQSSGSRCSRRRRMNGDGFPDVIVGARSYFNGQVNEGAAFVYLGGILWALTHPGLGGRGRPSRRGVRRLGSDSRRRQRRRLLRCHRRGTLFRQWRGQRGARVCIFRVGWTGGTAQRSVHSRAECRPERAQLSWPVIPNATAYDVVLGDLGQLLLSGGDFSKGATRCIANDSTGTLHYDRTSIGVGEVIFYLVRGLNPSFVGSYDVPGAGQVGSRDAEIAASIGACP